MMPPTVRQSMANASAGLAKSLGFLPHVPDNVQHLIVDVSVGGDEVRGRRIERRAVHSGDAAARFFDDEPAGGDVPWLQVLFPERLEAPRRHVTEIERRGAEAAH